MLSGRSILEVPIPDHRCGRDFRMIPSREAPEGVDLLRKLGYYRQEQAHHHGDHMPQQQSCRAPVAPYLLQGLSRSNGTREVGSRPASPASGPQQPIFNDPMSRRASQASAIAPSFQIPRSVNDSGGSLAELAAQITCLFWFESADTLKQVEESQGLLPLQRSLVLDARPSTGFRKWVTTILSTTLVAQNVVLLALLFIYRLKKLNPTVRGKPGSEYRLLTVALMLGNKFLDDNTYTNKTWAEVSGIVVGEVHIMEVEFLSNMKYCLFTSADDWASWQTLLGKFAAFLEKASQPQQRPPPILPPASSLKLPMALPSPPASNQASPPYSEAAYPNAPAYGSQLGPTPAPSPLKLGPDYTAGRPASRKRSLDDHVTEPPPKRIATTHRYNSPTSRSLGTVSRNPTQQVPRLTLPSLSMPNSSSSSGPSLPPIQGHQLPPISVPARAMALVYPSSTCQSSVPQLPAVATPSSQPSQYQSKQQSPFPGSACVSPTAAAPSTSTTLHPPTQVSPTYLLQQRNSPYRPVHNVSTLLYPPPSEALQQRSQNVEYSQMHYQPLGKPSQQRQSGRLPYVSQNVWVDGNEQHPMTPVHQWPGFLGARHHPAPHPQH
ncbi:hypothetical protein EJ03DRAFT_341196 [Teratosphaeria nubilosa]|uniref:Cyclin-domain-containing protein n=1 Tax=Teratosphaeria nubilosa TaxID=161662 RepID=A0A6G1LJ42_9PEZI|nr:hypothetical protein EJ03DRAFT_341196 [Teratosphaeria nubilosa]